MMRFATGIASVNDTPVITNAFGLVTVMVSTVVEPTEIVDGVKLLLITGEAGVTVSVAVLLTAPAVGVWRPR